MRRPKHPTTNQPDSRGILQVISPWGGHVATCGGKLKGLGVVSPGGIHQAHAAHAGPEAGREAAKGVGWWRWWGGGDGAWGGGGGLPPPDRVPGSTQTARGSCNSQH